MGSPAITGVRACVFDAYGTLFDVRSAVERFHDRLGGEAAAFSALWFRKKVEYTWLRSLMGRYADFWHVTQDALDFTLASFGPLDPALRADLLDAYLHLDAYPEVDKVLRRLRKGGRATAILSNGTPAMLASAVEYNRLGDVVGAVLSADAAGVFKPDPRVYRLAVEQLGVDADAILFLSANAWDVAGAAAFGLRVVWVNRAGAPDEYLPGTPAGEVPTLEPLPALLGL